MKKTVPEVACHSILLPSHEAFTMPCRIVVEWMRLHGETKRQDCLRNADTNHEGERKLNVE